MIEPGITPTDTAPVPPLVAAALADLALPVTVSAAGIEVVDEPLTTPLPLADLNHLTTQVAAMDAIYRWYIDRPVSDGEAAGRGVAVLGWRPGIPAHAWTADPVDPGAVLRWEVVCPRPGSPNNLWVPAVGSTAVDRMAVTASALRRAARLPVNPVQRGEVTIWGCLEEPLLSTAVLTSAPFAEDPDVWVVATPGRPVVTGSQHAVRRLSEEATDRHVAAPAAAFKRVGWVS